MPAGQDQELLQWSRQRTLPCFNYRRCNLGAIVDSTLGRADSSARGRCAAREHIGGDDSPDARGLGIISPAHATNPEDAAGRSESGRQCADRRCDADGNRCGGNEDLRQLATDARPGGALSGVDHNVSMRVAPSFGGGSVELGLGYEERKTNSGLLRSDAIDVADGRSAVHSPDAEDDARGVEPLASELCHSSMD